MALEENENNKTNKSAAAQDGAATKQQQPRKRKRRWGDKPPDRTTTSTTATTSNTTSNSSTAADPNRVLALQESIKARLAAAKAKQQPMGGSGGILPVTTATAAAVVAPTTMEQQQRPIKRAKHYELDLSVTGPTFQQAAKPTIKKKINPYLAHLSPGDDAPPDETTATATTTTTADHRNKQDETSLSTMTMIRASKPRPRHREIQFVEPGHWQQVAEKKREKAALAAAAGYVSGRKAGHTIQAAGLGDIYGRGSTELKDDDDDDHAMVSLPPRADAHPDTRMPLCMEWWDMELLPSKVKKQVATTESKALSKQSQAALQHLEDGARPKRTEKNNDDDSENGGKDDNDDDYDDTSAVIHDLRQSCFAQASLSYCKTAALVQHIVPVRPPAYQGGPTTTTTTQPVLHLTKRELKRQRKLRRQEKQRELQDLQAAGLMPAPEPRLTLRNFMQVLGDQAFVDPSQMEQKVTAQIQARQRAHLERNQANKLSKEQRAAKRERKIQEDTTTGVTVAVFYVQDMSHPYHRAKVDLNAQQFKISGGVLECQNPPLACVICEGGPKAIQKYRRLMLVRMKWTGPDDALVLQDDNDNDEEEDGEYQTQKFNPNNKCDLVWQGLAVKPSFKGFFFQSCETSDQARKLLKNKGVAHYWDQVLRHASGRDAGVLPFKLTASGDDHESDNPYENQNNEEEDIIMKE